MTDIERTLSRLTRAHKHLTQLEAKLDEYDDQTGDHIDMIRYLVGACADQEANIDQLYLRLAIQKHGHDWDSIKAMAKDIKRSYIGGR
jgi:hypothetical protein